MLSLLGASEVWWGDEVRVVDSMWLVASSSNSVQDLSRHEMDLGSSAGSVSSTARYWYMEVYLLLTCPVSWHLHTLTTIRFENPCQSLFLRRMLWNFMLCRILQSFGSTPQSVMDPWYLRRPHSSSNIRSFFILCSSAAQISEVFFKDVASDRIKMAPSRITDEYVSLEGLDASATLKKASMLGTGQRSIPDTHPNAPKPWIGSQLMSDDYVVALSNSEETEVATTARNFIGQ
jgi:hypothetical protein